jgi:hypothetical protein
VQQVNDAGDWIRQMRLIGIAYLIKLFLFMYLFFRVTLTMEEKVIKSIHAFIVKKIKIPKFVIINAH